MSEQPALFDVQGPRPVDPRAIKAAAISAAQERRDRGMRRALDRTDSWSQQLFDQWLRAQPVGSEVTADDYRAVVPDPVSLPAIGGMFSRAAKRGSLKRISYRPSERPESHGRIVAVWRVTGRRREPVEGWCR